MVRKINITVSITPDLNEQLEKLALFSGETKSQLIAEALQLLMKQPKEKTK